MEQKDSVRFLASQLMGLGQSARQDTQMAQNNEMQKRYLQLAELKDAQQQKLQQQQTAVGALEQMAQTKGVQDMIANKDSDPSHLALYVAKAKADIYNQNPQLRQQLPSAMSGMKIPFYSNRPSPSFGIGAQPAQQINMAPSGAGRQKLVEDLSAGISGIPGGSGFLLGLKALQNAGSGLSERYKNF